MTRALRTLAACLFALAALRAQDRQLPLEDIIKEKASHLRITGVWVSGGAFDLRFRGGNGATAPGGPIRA